MFTFLSDKAVHWSLGAYLAARVALSVWAFVVALLFPVVLQNLDLFGTPTLAVFDLASGERYAYSREVDGAALTFRAGDPGFVTDMQTGSVWSLREGRAMMGKYAGRALAASPYSVEEIFPYRGVAVEQNLLLSAWQRFDTNWYLAIAQRGYSDDGSTVYFPLYPLLIRTVGALVGNSMLAALLISNLALIGALALLYRQARELGDVASARRATGYLLMMPVSFFFFAAYTESIFLLFALSAFTLVHQGKWLLATLVGVLAAFTRLQGLLIVVPLAYLWWHEWREIEDARSKKIARGLILLLIPIASATFFLVTNLSFLATLESQWQAQFAMPWQVLTATFEWWASGRASWVDALNLGSVVFTGIMLVVVWRSLPREYGLYTLLLLMMPLLRLSPTQPFVSATRYLAPMFPVLVVLGRWGKSAWVNRAVVYLGFPLQLLLSAQFVMWGWVG